MTPLATLLESAAARKEAGDLRGAADLLDRAARQDRAAALPLLHEVLEALVLDVDGVRWRYIPGGTFRVGNDFGDLDERPATATLSGFYLTEAPLCVEDIARNYKELEALWLKAPLVKDAKLFNHMPGKTRPLATRTPLVGVTWDVAQRLASRARGRVPRELEWERAARGCFVDAQYPWGDALPSDAVADTGALHQHPPRTGPMPSRAFPPNDYGLFGMSGGVWELCDDVYDALRQPSAHGFMRVIRGGSFLDDPEALRVSFRASFPSAWMSPLVGVRLARDV